MQRARVLLLALTLLPLWAAASCVEADCALAAAAASPVTHEAYWQSNFRLPLVRRTGLAPASLVDYIRLDNLHTGRPERPEVYSVAPTLLVDLRAVINELPPPLQAMLQSRLAGVYLASHIGSTGYTEEIHDTDGHPVAAVIVLDTSILGGRGANAWATWKENTPFRADGGWSLKAEIEHSDQDNRRNAIQYILLHEIGHVLSVRSGLVPSWHQQINGSQLQRYPFTALSWQLVADGAGMVSRHDAAFPLREQVIYYRQPLLPAASMVEVYQNLAASDFVTLYGATNPYDDFAEAFASYVHVVLQHKPFVVSIYHQGRLQYRYEACWGQPRCAAKEALLRQLLPAN